MPEDASLTASPLEGMSATHRIAILMLALGEDEAAEVMKYLGPREVQKLGAAMATMKGVANRQLEQVLEDFRQETEQASALGVDSDEYIRQVLTKALGDDKASVLLARILGGKDASGIESLKWMDAQSVAELIRNEHPQIIATILVHLERDQACEIMGHFSDRLRNDVVLRIATLDGVQPAALRELNDVLTKLLSGNENIKKSSLGGVRTALNRRGRVSVDWQRSMNCTAARLVSSIASLPSATMRSR